MATTYDNDPFADYDDYDYYDGQDDVYGYEDYEPNPYDGTYSED